MDEFQEFFVEDDRIAQEAALLLDRLVRQGRAFGMHVLLGSQTLGGAYSLARSTIDQMAVRIALQCSEADAHLILSDDNSAARLLSRPGEAIYNDANGLVEGNDPFQVVWLRRRAARGVPRRASTSWPGSSPPKPRPATVVFEGNAPADVAKNHLLERLLTGRPRSGVPTTTGPAARHSAWLGEAMAINDLTAAVFRRQNGSNLLIVGQQAETGAGHAGHGHRQPGGARMPAAGDARVPRFYVVDGRQARRADAGRRWLACRTSVPEPVRLAGWRDVPAVMAELAAELERRQKEAEAARLDLPGPLRPAAPARPAPAGGRLRLHAPRRGEGRPAGQQLATLLREGPALGIHTLIWCDTLNNLQRALDRQAMRKLEHARRCSR